MNHVICNYEGSFLVLKLLRFFLHYWTTRICPAELLEFELGIEVFNSKTGKTWRVDKTCTDKYTFKLHLLLSFSHRASNLILLWIVNLFLLNSVTSDRQRQALKSCWELVFPALFLQTLRQHSWKLLGSRSGSRR